MGYSPAVGGAMSSGWQSDNLGVNDGINNINRSSEGYPVSSVEAPFALVGGADLRIIFNTIYLKAGMEYLYQYSGGSGKTLNKAGDEVVDAVYTQWSLDAPLTIGISLLFWGEARIYTGAGFAFAYGTYSSSFESASLNHSAEFTGYAVPLVAEIGCEYMITENISVGCDIKYFNGKSALIEDGADYARIDFSGFHITASASYHLSL
jgi:opacity protein-like surface antigen